MSTPSRTTESIPLGLAQPKIDCSVPTVSAKRKQTQTVVVQIKGSMTGFHMIGPDAATWRPMEGKHAQIFGIDTHDNGAMSAEIMGEAGNKMESNTPVHITKATVLQSHNTFDVPLGVTVNCLPKTEAVDTGDKYTFTTIPKASVNTPHVIYQADEGHDEGATWRASFPSFNSKNLETQGVLTLHNCPYVFVNEKHPVIGLIKVNKHSLGVDLNEMPKMDGEWYKLSTTLMTSCCDTIRNRILNKFRQPETDLSQMCVQLHRLGGIAWNHTDKADVLSSFKPDPTWDQDKLKNELLAHENRFLQTPGTFMSRIQFEYEVPN